MFNLKWRHRKTNVSGGQKCFLETVRGTEIHTFTQLSTVFAKVVLKRTKTI